MPEPVDTISLSNIRRNTPHAAESVVAARLAIMDLLGFLFWVDSVPSDWKTHLADSELEFFQSLCLEDRPKRGSLFKLLTDFQHANFQHWARNNVPFHLLWTDEEESQGRFRRYRPRFLNEIIAIRDRKGDGDVMEYKLSFFEEIKEDLERYDEFYQDRYSERHGAPSSLYQPDFFYYVIDFLQWGMRPIKNWHEIRACAERFKSTRARRDHGTSVMFWRQSPLQLDEPWHARSYPETHRWPLTKFAKEEVGTGFNERALYLEDTVITREKWKTFYAPQPGFTYNPYDGRMNGLESLRAHWESHRANERLGVSSSRFSRRAPASRQRGGGEFYASRSSSPTIRRRSSCSLSPQDRGCSYSSCVRENRYRSSSLSSESTAETRTQREAVAALKAVMSTIMELYPSHRERSDLVWNEEWLDKAIIVFKDPRTHLRMKILANCYQGVNDMRDILSTAWRFGFKMHLFVPLDSAPTFCTPLSDIESLTLPRIYDPGFTERYLSKVPGRKAQYAMWLGSAKEITQQPNAVAFISEGGLLSEIAQIIDTDLIRRFAQGPSAQVSHFGKGETFLQRHPPGGGPARFFASNRITEAECMILIGLIPGENNNEDRSLFPLPSTFEGESDHVHGMIGEGALKIVSNILKDLEKGICIWRTDGHRRGYLRQNNRGVHAPKYKPTDEAFETVGVLTKRAFPINWNGLPVREIDIPEAFDARAHGDWGAL
ncbi:hypothetical protein B0H16DRAFT_1319501 [Mycena metata]|uniref:Uncharacterized protein n=1 Tax=Mycena metata TaxID=1033252 RepID=A0AAD7N6U0_9AGAR|nr:hypothetical protein B0H16DRAFT_1319501 [Mycena metata]